MGNLPSHDDMDTTPGMVPPVQEMCDPNMLDDDEFSYIALVASVVIIIILSVLERRANPHRCPSLRGHLAIVIPVNLLDQGRDRLGYAASFGSMASVCFQLFTNNQQETLFDTAPNWSKTLVLMLLVLRYCFWYYPIFACLATDWVFIGSVLGAAYSVCWFLLNLKEVIECPTGDGAMFTGENIAIQMPCLVCLFVLIIRFIVMFTKHVILIVRSWGTSQLQPLDRRKRLSQPHHMTYVRLLLAPAGPSTTEYSDIAVEPAPKKVVRKFCRWFYQNDPTFKYSPRIIAITTVSIICLYQFSILIVLATNHVQHLIPRHFLPDNSSTPDPQDESTFRQVRLFLDVFASSVAVAFVFSTLLSLLAIFQMLTIYRASMQKMFKGQYNHLPFKRNDQPAYTVLSYSMSYAGSQIAYTLWGFLVSILMSTIVCLIVAYLIVLPAIGKVPIELLEYFANLLPGFAIILVFSVLQRVLSAFLVQRRDCYTTEGRTTWGFDLALNNRKIYHNVQFVLFFFYVVLGVFGCFWNIVKSIILGVFFLSRLDKCRLMPGFESWDMGHNYHTSFLHVEEVHRHPVVVVCCDILLHVCHDREDMTLQNYGSCVESPDVQSYTSLPLTRQRARNRWFKAYTLLRNKQLVKDTDDDFDKLSDLGINFDAARPC